MHEQSNLGHTPVSISSQVGNWCGQVPVMVVICIGLACCCRDAASAVHLICTLDTSWVTDGEELLKNEPCAQLCHQSNQLRE